MTRSWPTGWTATCDTGRGRRVGAWRSLVARTLREGEVPGSNPGAPIYLPYLAAIAEAGLCRANAQEVS